MNWETSAYTARYVMKKQIGKDLNFYKKLGVYPEFVRMSRKPGLARFYYEKNKYDIYRNDEIFIKNSKGVFAVKPPRYFDRLMEDLDFNLLVKLKENRRLMADRKYEIVVNQTDLSEEDYNKVRINNRVGKLKVLIRKDI